MDESIFRQALMEIPAVVAIVRGPAHLYEFANKMHRTLGGMNDDVIGTPFGSSTTMVVQDELRKMLERVRVTGEALSGREYHLRISRGPDAVVKDAYFDFHVVPIGDQTADDGAILTYVVDSTDRVEERRRTAIQHEQIFRQREALRASESHFRRIVESNMCGMAFWDKAGAITDANDAFLEIVGYTRDDLAFGQIRWLTMTPPDLSGAEQLAHEELAERGVCTPFEKAYVRKDGKHVLVLIGIARFKDPDAALGGVTFVLDITERKRMEAQLIEAQKLESLSVLAGGVAHDFNNLLAEILGNASNALSSAEPGSPSATALEDIMNASRRASALARQLLTYTGRNPVRASAVDLAAHVREIAQLLHASVRTKVTIEFDLPMGLPAASCDVSQLQQVVMNLLINAAEASGDRLGVVRVAIAACRFGEDAIDELGLSPGSYLCLEVSDDGCGMTPATRERIFDPFFTTKAAGRGLGLAAVKGIMRAHGGAITVRSLPLKGSTFRVFFPSTSALAPRDVKRPESWKTFRGTGRVLLVDDEVNLRVMARRLLEQIGFDVVEAANGREALDRFGASPNDFALVLLDMTMPGMSGVEVFRSLARLRPDVRVVLSSGFSETNVREMLANQEVAGLLEKPYSVEDLVETVRSALAAPAP